MNFVSLFENFEYRPEIKICNDYYKQRLCVFVHIFDHSKFIQS